MKTEHEAAAASKVFPATQASKTLLKRTVCTTEPSENHIGTRGGITHVALLSLSPMQNSRA